MDPSATRSTPCWLPWLAMLLAGALAPLSFSPVDWWPLGIVSVMGYLHGLRGADPRQAVALGWAYGLGFWGVGASWVYVSINVYGNASPPFAAFLTLLFVMALALLFSLQAWIQRRYFSAAPVLLCVPALWVLMEWFRSWFLTGFPWLYLGYAHVETPLAGWAPVFGVMGVSWVIAASAVTLHQLLSPAGAPTEGARALASARQWICRPGRRPGLLLLAGLWLCPLLLSRVTWVEEVPEQRITASLVQANIDQGIKFDRAFLQDSLNLYDELTAPLWENELILWPETAIPLLYHQAAPFLEYLDAQARLSNSTLITGILYQDGNRIHNSITSLGRGEGLYHKQKLVPFGEYVPLETLMSSLLQIFDLPMSSLSPGPVGQDMLSAGNLRLPAFICYEVVYADFVRRMARDADILITVSNDTWFGGSFGPHQHLQMAAMRALENGRYMVRGTNNGISAVIDEKGRVLARTPQFQAAVLSHPVKVFSGDTPFNRWGSWPVLLLAATLLLLSRPRTSRLASRS